MTARSTLLRALLAAALCLPGPAAAQSLARRPMPARGGVSGLELALDGATSGHRGATLRWFATLYEVVGHDELRPAARGSLRLLASFRPDEALAEVRTDGRGRAELEVPIPTDQIGAFRLVIEARSGAVGRTFDMTVETLPGAEVGLVPVRREVQPGERASVLGRLLRLPSRRAVAGHPLVLSVQDQDGRSLGPDREIRTGPSGTFVASFVAPEDVSRLRFSVDAEGLAQGSATVVVSAAEPPRMVVRAVPTRTVVAPDEEVPVSVMVRRADGRPVAGAHIRLDGAPEESSDRPPIRTASDGRATVVFHAPGRVGEAVEQVGGAVTVSRAGLGSATGRFSIAVARQPYEAAVEVEGGALLPDLPSRVYVRVVQVDDVAPDGVPVQLESPLLGTLTGATDASGVAVLEGRPRATAGIEGRDRCGGATASAVTIRVGRGDEAASLERCLPVDPEGTVRPRLSRPVVAAGEPVTVELFVAPRAARYPIEVTLLSRREESLVPVSRRLVEAGRGRLELRAPEDAPGQLLLRARPLVGRSLVPVRGGVAMLWVTAGESFDVEARHVEGQAVVTSTAPPDGGEAVLLVVPAEVEPSLSFRIVEGLLPPSAERFEGTEEASDSLHEGWLAALAARDDAAPAALRGSEAVSLPAPESPVASGVLRDPVRARARYVRGRLALVIRTLERQLDDAIPERVSDLGVETPGGWELNREALRAVIGAHLLRDRVPTTLGGDPLTLEDLSAFDRSFTFDSLARRVTRRRLLALLVAIRDFVRDRELDLWQRRGDPALWLRVMVEDGALDENGVFDGWGRPMTIRRAPGGRARFGALAPLPAGYELVSAGPDGRFGTGDDLHDPFARAVPRGSAYADAVGEEELLARLSRVELDQATIATLLRLFQEGAGGASDGYDPDAEELGWEGIGAVVHALDPVELLERGWVPVDLPEPTTAPFSGEARAPLSLGEEPRRYSVVGLVAGADGWLSTSSATFRAGYPVLASAPPLDRIRAGEPLRLPVAVARLPGAPEELVVEVESSGVLAAELDDGGTRAAVSLDRGGGGLALVRLSASDVGEGSARIVVRDRQGRGRREIRLPVRVEEGGLLRSQAAAGAVTGDAVIRLEMPDDAASSRAILVLSPPTGFVTDPTVRRWLDEDPALVAWAMSVAGQTLPPRLLRSLESATERDGTVRGESPALSTACAAVAWAAATEGIDWAQRATESAAARLSEPSEEPSANLASDASALAALSVAAGPGGHSSLSRSIERLRDSLRRALRTRRDETALLARAAAALLLADRRDLRGQLMLTLLRERLGPGLRGGLVAQVGEEHDDDAHGRAGAEQLVATAALAIAAHQAGDRQLAAELGRGAAARAHVAASLGGEPLFWMLAARAFGVYGYADDLSVTVEQGAERQQVTLGGEARTLPLELPRPGSASSLRLVTDGEATAVPLAQTVVRYVRPPREQEAGPLEVELSGDTGFAGERAAFVVEVSNRGTSRVDRPVLLVGLPAGASLDGAARRALSVETVLSVDEPDRRGVARVSLAPLGAGESLRLPLGLLWTAAGRRQGVTLAAFPADRSWELTVAAPAELDVPFRSPDGRP